MRPGGEDDETINKTFTKYMKPLIQRWERHIIAAGTSLEPSVSEEEIQAFAQRASNSTDARQFLEKWNAEDVNIEEELPEIVQDETDEFIEVVVSDDEIEDEEEEEDEMMDFIVDG